MHLASTENRMVAYHVMPKFFSGSEILDSNLHDLTQHGHAAKGHCSIAAGHIFLNTNSNNASS